MFQAGGLVVIVVEIFRRNFLASMVPVIVNAILNEHQLVIDIVAFVIKGDFHRSRLGEKQRGKILAGWVTRKMRTIAQYSIRDPNGQDGLGQMMISEEPVGRPSMSMSMSGMPRGPGGPGSTKGSMRAGSLGLTAQMNSLALQTGAQDLPGQTIIPPQASISQLPDQRSSYYPESIPELSTEAHEINDRTPTTARPNFLPQLEQGGPTDYSPIDRTGVFDDNSEPGTYQNAYHSQQYGHPEPAELPDILRPGPVDDHPASHTNTFYSDSTPYYAYEDAHDSQKQEQDRWNAPSQSEPRNDNEYRGYYDRNEGGGGLRVANRDSSESESADETWRKDALAGLSLVGQGQPGGQGHAPGTAH